jgi:hypothetical protein
MEQTVLHQIEKPLQLEASYSASTSSCKASSRHTILHRNMGRPTQYSFSPANSHGRPARAFLDGLATVAIVITVFASVTANSQRGASPPRLVLEKPRHDFGETFAGEDLSHVFWVRNLGAAALELSERPLLTTRPSKAFATDPLRESRRPLAVKATSGTPPPT